MLPKSGERKGVKNRKRKFREREKEECISDDNAAETEKSLVSPPSTESINSNDEWQFAI
jgi:hypothetical protein